MLPSNSCYCLRNRFSWYILLIQRVVINHVQKLICAILFCSQFYFVEALYISSSFASKIWELINREIKLIMMNLHDSWKPDCNWHFYFVGWWFPLIFLVIFFSWNLCEIVEWFIMHQSVWCEDSCKVVMFARNCLCSLFILCMQDGIQINCYDYEYCFIVKFILKFEASIDCKVNWKVDFTYLH